MDTSLTYFASVTYIHIALVWVGTSFSRLHENDLEHRDVTIVSSRAFPAKKANDACFASSGGIAANKSSLGPSSLGFAVAWRKSEPRKVSPIMIDPFRSGRNLACFLRHLFPS